MKAEPVFTMPSWLDDAHDILNQGRGQARRMSLHLIIIETLRATNGKPTKDQLQKFYKTRRIKFIAMLKYLLETESVKRSGQGTKLDQFVYELGDKERRRYVFSLLGKVDQLDQLSFAQLPHKYEEESEQVSRCASFQDHKRIGLKPSRIERLIVGISLESECSHELIGKTQC